MKIYFINSKIKNCGVYQYGVRLWESLKKTNLDITYFEIQSKEEFLSLCIETNRVDVIFFNWIDGGISGPFGWVDADLLSNINLLNIKTISILHTDKTIEMDLLISQNPIRSGMPRPLYNFDTTKTKPINNILNIGSIGFAGHHKDFPKIVKKVNDELQEAQINLNITNANYGDQDSTCLNEVIKNIYNIPLKPGIKLNLTTNFLSNEELLDFVYQNDLVIFAYNRLNDIASVVDYAISTETPIGVTNIGAFEHVYKKEIDIDKNNIYEIIDYYKKNNFIKCLKDQWSQDHLKNFLEQQITNTLSNSQVYQDIFVYKLIGKNGFFLDIGAGWDDSLINSNTYILEKFYGWDGICIDANEHYLLNRKIKSVRSKCLCCRIPETTIETILDNHNAPIVIDYLSIDIDPMSIIALQNFPFDKYSFKILTFEHDLYAQGPEQKKQSYDILTSYGYIRLCENVRVPDAMGQDNYFEDWWINPKYFSKDFIDNNSFKNEKGLDIITKLRYNYGNNR